jgi:hypothetical protein
MTSIPQMPMEKRDMSHLTSKSSLFRHETELMTQPLVRKKNAALPHTFRELIYAYLPTGRV